VPVITSEQARISVSVSALGGTTIQTVIDDVSYLGHGDGMGTTGQFVLTVYRAQTDRPSVRFGFRRDAGSEALDATPGMLKFPGEQ
jgi:hypothetical protein